MKNNKMTKVLCLSIAALTTFASCGRTPDGEVGGGSSKTSTLIVASYDGGVGNVWLDNVIEKFEEANKDVSFEEGKVGVTVKPVKEKKSLTTAITSTNYDVIFDEAVKYYSIAATKAALPLDDLVAEVNTDGKTIESKLTEQQKNGFTALDGHYYGLPHYEYFGGVAYDIDVFDRYKLYLSADKNNGNDGFIVDNQETRSLGPDGATGIIDGVDYSKDDGLPATYEEFYALLKYMDEKNVTPFIWTGKYESYMDNLLTGLFFNLNGYEDSLVNFTFKSETDPVTGQPNPIDVVKGFDAAGKPIIEEEVITPSNAYQIFQQAGRYYALEFLEKIFSDPDYYYSDSISGTLSHTAAMMELVYGYLENNPIAFIVEGSYWYTEAVDLGVIETVAADGYGDEARNRRFGWMPLPTQYSGTVAPQTKQTLGEVSEAYMFINANLASNPTKATLAKKFVKFAYTDEMLEQFTLDTGITKALKYDVSEETYDKLSAHGKSNIDMKRNANIIYSMSDHDIFLNDPTRFSFVRSNYIWKTDNYMIPVAGMKQGAKAKTLFEQLAVSQSDWNNKYSQYFD